MGTFFLETGLIIQREGVTLEYVSRHGNDIYFEEPTSGQRITISEPVFWGEFNTQRLTILNAFSSPKVLKTPTEPASTQIRGLSSLPEKYQQDVDRKVTYISNLKKAGITRGQRKLIIEESAKIAAKINDPKGAPGASTIQYWWKNLETNQGEVYVLINGHSEKTKKKTIDNDSEEFLQRQIDEKYALDTRPTASGAYLAYRNELKNENLRREKSGLPLLRRVSQRSFYARIEARPKKELMVARFGREAARHHFKMIKGHLPCDYPLDYAEIDHTPLNLYVIDDESYLPLGRPWLTAIKDRRSGMLLGFYVSFTPTGLSSIFGALKHSLVSHHLAYEQWPDIENPWASFGRAHYYESDRGADFKSQRYRTAIVSIGSMYEYCERRTPWLKGSIERFFLTLEQTFFESIPGRTFSNLSQRAGYNPSEQAVIRFTTLIYLLHKWAADFHNVFPNARNQARPIDIWMDEISLAPPPYPNSPDALNIILGEHNTGTLSQEGLRYKWITYASDELSQLMNEIGKGIKLSFAVQIEDLGHIYALSPITNRYFLVPSTRPDYSCGLSVFQHLYLRRQRGLRLDASNAIDTLVETRASIQKTIRQELDLGKTAVKSKLARMANINSNAALEGKPQAVGDPFRGQSVSSETVPNEKQTVAPCTSVPRPSWGA